MNTWSYDPDKKRQAATRLYIWQFDNSGGFYD
jgi:hypothetical protein